MNLADLKELVYKAQLGPSPFNIQAVKYIYGENNESLYVRLDNERAFIKPLTAQHTLKEHCIGVGACIYNIKLAAPKLGYKAIVTYCPDSKDDNLLAKIEFEKCATSEHELYPFIEKSWSNRVKMQKDRVIPQEQMNEIKNIVAQYGDRFTLDIVTDEQRRNGITKIAAAAEAMNWSIKGTQSKHRHYLKFTSGDMEKKRDGIAVWEFGIPKIFGPAAAVFTKWPVYRFFVPLGIGKFVGWTSRAKKGKCVRSYFVFLEKGEVGVKQWLEGGEMIQHVLLYAKSKNIDHQWFSSIYIWDDVENGLGDPSSLSDSYQKKAENLSKDVRQLLGVKSGEYILASLALGYTDVPMNPKFRRSVDTVLTVQSK